MPDKSQDASPAAKEVPSLAGYSLPDSIDRGAIASAMREIVVKLNETFTYEELEEEIKTALPDAKRPISASLIRHFVSVASPTPRVNSNNVIVPGLYNYIHRVWQSLNPDVRNFAAEQFSRIRGYNYIDLYLPAHSTSDVYALSRTTNNLLRIPPDRIHELGKRLQGQFCLFRKSMEKENIVLRSEIIVDPRHDHNTIIVAHVVTEQDDNTQRVSFGFAYPIENSIYFNFFSTNLHSVEFAVINYKTSSQPIAASFGFIETSDSSARIVPLSARMYLVRRSETTNKLGKRIDLTAYKDVDNELINRIKNAIDGGTSRKIRS